MNVFDLTPREKAVLTRLANGWTTAEIMSDLNLTVHMVKYTLHLIYEKTGTGDRAQAVATALRTGDLPLSAVHIPARTVDLRTEGIFHDAVSLPPDLRTQHRGALENCPYPACSAATRTRGSRCPHGCAFHGGRGIGRSCPRGCRRPSSEGRSFRTTTKNA